MSLRGALAVFRFELRRTLTLSRLAVWLLLVLFPVFIVSVMKHYEPSAAKDLAEGPGSRSRTVTFHDEALGRVTLAFQAYGNRRTVDVAFGEGHNQRVCRDIEIPEGMTVNEMLRHPNLTEAGGLLEQLIENAQQQMAQGPDANNPEILSYPIADPLARDPTYPPFVWGAVFFGLIPEVITLFGLLLWVTPLVHAELEGRTWIYLAVRPHGRTSVLLGKYMTAVTWTALAGWTSTTICVLIARPESPMRLWATMVALVGFSCIAYAALYSLIGVVLHRRAMVIAVGYTLVFEFIVTMIPAVINKLTVQYRLRNLLVQWMDWKELRFSREAQGYLLGDEPAWLHVLILGGIAVGLVLIAAQFIQRKEYVTAAGD